MVLINTMLSAAGGVQGEEDHEVGAPLRTGQALAFNCSKRRRGKPSPSAPLVTAALLVLGRCGRRLSAPVRFAVAAR
jgi:hypothetical protein